MKSHRGLSSVIGAVFLIAIVIGALSYITYSLEIMGNFSEALITEESRLSDKQREAYEITSIDITAANKLDGILKNTGQIPVKLTTLWIDEQGVNDVVQKYTMDKAISPGSTINLIDLADVDIDPTKGYNMKFVTSRGEVQTIFLNSPNQQSLDIQLFALPEIIPSDFTSTLIMTVVNNMTNNNVLVNLTPNDPTPCTGNCQKLSGPIPTSYNSLEAGEVAIFRWGYKLTGVDQDTFSFTGSLQNGVSGNTDSTTVTIGVPVYADVAGQSIMSLGFGQSQISKNALVLHVETYGIPTAADYQMSLSVPDTQGTSIIFNTGVSKQWFTANVTVADIDIPAGNWNASLRYNSPRLPDGMVSGADTIWELFTANLKIDEGGGHILHFNTNEATGIYDSVLETTCSDLTGAAIKSGVTYSSNLGVNGSGAYYFDGNDYIQIANAVKKQCNNIDKWPYSIAGWFNGTITASDTTQTIWSYQDNDGKIEVEIGDGTSGNHGHLFFTHTPESGAAVVCESATNYLDEEWHHFVAVVESFGSCKLYVDGTLKQTTTGGSTEHVHQQVPVYIGSKSGTSNFFTGYLDDLMFWNNYALTSTDVTALKDASFGNNAHRINFVINNATGVGTTVNNIVTSNNYGLPYVDQGRYTDVDTLWAGSNYTATVSEVGLNLATENRLDFTMSYAGGFPLNLRVDDDDLKPPGTTFLSSYLQVPMPDQPLPVFSTHSKSSKVTFFAFNAGDEGVWFTYPGTRIVFNGTNGHFTGIVDTISDGTTMATMNSNTDSPFLKRNSQADIVFWQPQAVPKASVPSPADEIIPGSYVVSAYLSGYDEDGTMFVRSMNLGTILVTE